MLVAAGDEHVSDGRFAIELQRVCHRCPLLKASVQDVIYMSWKRVTLLRSPPKTSVELNRHFDMENLTFLGLVRGGGERKKNQWIGESQPSMQFLKKTWESTCAQSCLYNSYHSETRAYRCYRHVHYMTDFVKQPVLFNRLRLYMHLRSQSKSVARS